MVWCSGGLKVSWTDASSFIEGSAFGSFNSGGGDVEEEAGGRAVKGERTEER